LMKFWTMYLSAVAKQNSSSCGKIPWDLFRPWVVSTKVHTSTRTSVERNRVWMCYIVIFLDKDRDFFTLWVFWQRSWFFYIVILFLHRDFSCEHKCTLYTCLVGALWKVIFILSTTYKVCVMLFCTLCEITQRSCRDRSPWTYLYDPRSGAHSKRRANMVFELCGSCA
jgi:hypothetical protein